MIFSENMQLVLAALFMVDKVNAVRTTTNVLNYADNVDQALVQLSEPKTSWQEKFEENKLKTWTGALIITLIVLFMWFFYCTAYNTKSEEDKDEASPVQEQSATQR